uniref:PWWP domain-containing protein n=1 Tax=Strigamia maritima TaxID=126957 RepID=T1JKC2_STRMM
MAELFNVGDLVWAKMKGFSPWPGKVVNPTKDVKRPANKKPMQCVFFFGTDNYAWIPVEGIKPYDQFKDQMTKQNKTSTFREAVEAIEDYIRNKPAAPIKTSDLPSIDEEIATIFPNGGSNRSPPHKDYSRQPFQNKPKNKSSSADAAESGTKLNSAPPSKTTPPKEKDVKESIKEPKEAKKEKPKKDPTASAGLPTTKSVGLKRASSDSSSASGSTGGKRVKADKQNDKASASVSTPSVTSTSTGSSGLSSPQTNHGSPRKTAESLLARPTYITRPVTPPLDVEKVSETLKRKNIRPSCLNFGFLGLGIMGQGIVKNLINSGHSVTVWNRTPSKDDIK